MIRAADTPWKRTILGALALSVAAVASIPFFGPVVGANGEGVRSALFLVAGGCLWACPVVALRLGADWRAKELLTSIALTWTIWFLGVWAFFFLASLGIHSRFHVRDVLIFGPLPLAPWLGGLAIARGIAWRMSISRRWGRWLPILFATVWVALHLAPAVVVTRWILLRLAPH